MSTIHKRGVPRAGAASGSGWRQLPSLLTPGRFRTAILAALGVACFFWPVAIGTEASYSLGAVVVAVAIGVIGLDLALGRLGMVHLGYGLFFGAGEYCVAKMSSALPDYLILAVAGAVIVGLVLGVMFGLVVCRLQGVLFAVATLAGSAAAKSIVTGVQGLGGPDGIGVLSTTALPGAQLTAAPLYVVCAIVFVLLILWYGRLRQSRLGRAMEAVRQSPTMAAVCGINSGRVRYATFIGSSAIAGLGGALFAVSVGYVSADDLGTDSSVKFLGMDIIGGFGSGWGTVPGAGLMRGLPQALQHLGGLQQVAIGAIIVLVIVWLRRGIAGPVDDGLRAAGAWLRKRLAGAPAPDADAGTDAKEPDRRDTSAMMRDALHHVLIPPPRRPLRVHQLSVSFGGVHALTDVDAEFPPGQVTALIGPNGSGKTTLINAITGVVRPVRGEVRVGEVPITRLPVHERTRHGVTRTFQVPQIADGLSVGGNIMVGTHRRDGKKRRQLFRPFRHRAEVATRQDVRQIAAVLGLTTQFDDPPDRLTAGQQRLLEVARCIAADGQVVLLDEPAAGLSDTDRAGLAEVVRALRDAGRTIVLIEHDVQFVAGLADSVIVLNQGRVLARGRFAEVIASQDVTEVYLGRSASMSRGTKAVDG